MTDTAALDAEITAQDAAKKTVVHSKKSSGFLGVSNWVWIGIAVVVLIVIIIVVVVILLAPAAAVASGSVASGAIASGSAGSGSGSTTSSSSSSSSSAATPTYPFPADSSSYGILNVSTASNMQEELGAVARMQPYGWKTNPTMQWQFRFIRAGTDPTRQVYAINSLTITESLQVRFSYPLAYVILPPRSG